MADAGSPPEIRGLDELGDKVSVAVKAFWKTRSKQAKKQGKKSKRKDTGSRKSVTGGKHVDGLTDVLVWVLVRNGIPADCIYKSKSEVQLPGYFRAEKQWDLLVVEDGELLACVEFKSMVGSFGNNQNNRSEEAVGQGFDFRVATREGAFAKTSKPWAGYLMLLEDSPKTQSAVKVKEPHFDVFPEFKDASYEKRFCETFKRLSQEGLFDCCAMIMASPSVAGKWREPDPQLTMRRFASMLVGHCVAMRAARA